MNLTLKLQLVAELVHAAVVDTEDLEKQVANRTKALRDASELKHKQNIQALIAQAFCHYCIVTIHEL